MDDDLKPVVTSTDSSIMSQDCIEKPEQQDVLFVEEASLQSEVQTHPGNLWYYSLCRTQLRRCAADQPNPVDTSTCARAVVDEVLSKGRILRLFPGGEKGLVYRRITDANAVKIVKFALDNMLSSSQKTTNAQAVQQAGAAGGHLNVASRPEQQSRAPLVVPPQDTASARSTTITAPPPSAPSQQQQPVYGIDYQFSPEVAAAVAAATPAGLAVAYATQTPLYRAPTATNVAAMRGYSVALPGSGASNNMYQQHTTAPQASAPSVSVPPMSAPPRYTSNTAMQMASAPHRKLKGKATTKTAATAKAFKQRGGGREPWLQVRQEQIEEAIPRDAGCIVHIFDRRINLDALPAKPTMYSLIRAWVYDDPYRLTPREGVAPSEYRTVVPNEEATIMKASDMTESPNTGKKQKKKKCDIIFNLRRPKKNPQFVPWFKPYGLAALCNIPVEEMIPENCEKHSVDKLRNELVKKAKKVKRRKKEAFETRLSATLASLERRGILTRK